MKMLRNWILSPHATANFALVLFVLVLNSLIVHRNSIALHHGQKKVNENSEALLESRTLFSSFRDAESDVLGYALTGDKKFLGNYEQTVANIPEQLRRLNESSSVNQTRTDRLDELNHLAANRIQHLQAIVDARQDQGFDAAHEVVLVDDGKELMDRIRQIIGNLQAEQSQLMGTGRQEQDHQLFKVLAANLVAVCFGTLLTIVAWSFVDRELRRRRSAEAAALSERQNLWVTLTSIGDGVIVSDNTGRVKLANPVAKQLMGNPGDVDGRFVPDIFSLLDATSRKPIANPLSHVLKEGTFAPPAGVTLLHREDGSEIPIEQNAAPIRDSMGRIVGAVLVFRDCSERERLEREKDEREQRFRILSECMPQKVWTARPDGKLDYVNHMLLEYTGLPADQLTGRDWKDLIHPDDVKHHLATWSKSLASGDMFEIEQRLLKHTGEYRWHLSRALPLYQPDSRIAMWVGTHTDIHDQKCAEEALREDHIRKDQFLALLAHELRNPLAPLSNAIQVFSSAQNDPAIASELLDIMRRQLRQMTRLIDDLLDLSRITTGRMRLRWERVNVASSVSAAVEAVQPLVNERRHKLTAVVPENEIWLEADPTRLAQILTNLLHNAAKYTDAEGQLWIQVEQERNQVIFRVRDNGPGISQEMLTKIFDVFTQVEWTLDRAHGGLGIGLTLVRTLVELHGGTVSAFSDGLGRGSEFVVRLPIKGETEHVPPPETPLPADQAAPLPELRILVVDDVQASAKTLAMMLRALNQNVETKFDGASAIEHASECDFDLIFLDIAMPQMDGLEVARRLRAIPKLRSIRLVALTGFGQNEDRTQSLQAGFNEHLTKPVSMDLLKEILRSHPAATAKSTETPA